MTPHLTPEGPSCRDGRYGGGSGRGLGGSARHDSRTTHGPGTRRGHPSGEGSQTERMDHGWDSKEKQRADPPTLSLPPPPFHAHCLLRYP